MNNSYQETISKRIDSFEDGYVFTAYDFLDITEYETVNKVLSRLNEANFIRRIIKGIYDKPIYSKLLDEYSAYNIEKIADALARKFNWSIAPSGETALNKLHLSSQISNEFIYISDGPYREYEIGNYKLVFKHAANKEISGLSYITILVIQALKSIGRDKVLNSDVSILKNLLTAKEKEIIKLEGIKASSWVYKIIKEVAND